MLTKIRGIQLRRRTAPRPRHVNETGEDRGSGTALAALIQALTAMEKIAEMAPVPYLNGAVGLVLLILESVRGDYSNVESLRQLASKCGTLMLDITKQLASGPDISADLEALVVNLFQTLKSVHEFYQSFFSQSKTRRSLIHKDLKERIDEFSRDVDDAQMRFQTLSMIMISQSLQTQQDTVYKHSSFELGEYFASGDQWVAFTATLVESGNTVIVKRYTSEDKAKRKLMHDRDRKAFKKNWYPHQIAYMGASHPTEEHPYNILRGVTSDHLIELTNALSYTVENTDSSSFDISKVHLTETGKIIVVDLEPCLVVAKKSKNDMPYWRSWQEICIELLSGDPRYEPNPAIEKNPDPVVQQRLEYLRPILGHIHSGGLRFQDGIELAFKRQALMLSESRRRLMEIGVQSGRNIESQSLRRDDLLRAFWSRSRDLHYVAHYLEPLEVEIGDIGYISGRPPRFTRLDNIYPEITGRCIPRKRFLQHQRFPSGRWTWEDVQGVVRHTFQFRESDAKGLANWKTGRLSITRDFLFGTISKPDGNGSVVDCSRAWECLAHRANDIAAEHAERGIKPSQLILVVYYKQQSGYATLRANKPLDPGQWKEAWAREGLDSIPEEIYFYESSPGGSDGVWGYFSFWPNPGKPHPSWTPKRDNEGEPWGWTFVSEDFTVEISKPSIKQYIRYVQL